MLKILVRHTSISFDKVIGSVLNGLTNYKVIQYHGELPDIDEDDVILFCGAFLVDQLKELAIVQKNRKISSLSGSVYPYSKGHVMVTYDPMMVERDYSYKSVIQWDVLLANRYAKTKSLDPPERDYKYVDDFTETIDRIAELYEQTGKKVRVACDLETVGLDEYNPDAYIVSISFTCEEGMAHVKYFQSKEENPQWSDYDDPLWDQINALLTSDIISLCGANWKFDRRWIRYRWGIVNTNFKMDTTLVGSLLDENRSNSLNTHAKIYTPIGGYDDVFNKTIDKSRMDLVPQNVLLPYAAGDTDACYVVAEKLKAELVKNKRLLRFYVELLHPSNMAFEDMEREGVLLDTDHYFNPETGLRKEVLDHLDTVEQRAFSLMNNRIKIKHKGMLTLTRSALIKDFMFTPLGLNLEPKMYTAKAKEKTAKYASTAMNHLQRFADHPKASEFISCIKEFNSAKKTLGTYIDGFASFLRHDGRFHPSYILFKGDYGGGTDGGTNTGRTAAKDPAVQTVPKHTIWAKKLRKGYIAPEGFCIVNWDYSQGELRIAACLANEHNMLDAYRKGIDLHLKTGSRLIGIPLGEAQHVKAGKSLEGCMVSDEFMELILKHLGSDDPECVALEDADKSAKSIIAFARQNGKAGNFGLLYGMGAAGYKIYARDSYGVTLTDKESVAARDDFFGLYPGLLTWHNTYKSFAKKHGYVTTPLGRVRHLPLVNSKDDEAVSIALRQAINAPVQATLSDLGQYALVKFKGRYGNPDACRMFMFTHDSLTAYVRTAEVDFWVPEVATIMETLPLTDVFGWKPQIPFLADAEVGENLAELEEIERCW